MLSLFRQSRAPFVVVGAILLLGLVFNVEIDVYRGFERIKLKALGQQQSGENIKTLGNLLAAVVDMETGARGFLLTGNDELLEPLVVGERNFSLAAEEANQRLTDPAQRNRLSSVQKLEQGWRIDYAEPLIRQRREARSGSEIVATQSLGVTVQGKRLIDEIRRDIRLMIDDETRSALEKNQELLELQEAIRIELLRLGFFILLTVLLLAALVLHAFMSSEQRNQELHNEVKTRRLAEQQALDGELRIEALIDSLAEGVAIIDEQGKIVYSNHRLSAMFGYDEVTLDGTNLLLLASIEERPRMRALLESARDPGQATRRVTVETLGRRSTAEIFAVEISFSRYATDQALFFAAVIRDISPRQKIEYDLRQALSLQQAIFDSADYAIISTDTSGRVRTMNRTAEELTGHCEGELNLRLSDLFAKSWVDQRVAKIVNDARLVPRDDQDLLTVPAACGETDEDEAELVAVDGRRHPVFISITVLKDERERQIGFLAVAKDLTERLAVERMKSEFVATVSHELRTPLAAILGSLALIHEGEVGEVSEAQKEFVEMAYENSVRLSHLIDDILDLSKIESGRVEQRPIEFLVDRFLQEAVDLNHGYAQKYGVAITLTDPVPPAMLYVDRNRLMQVVTNLLSNAVKFSPNGGTVQLGATASIGWIRIYVKDDGPGIPEAFWPKIFSKFAQADGSDTRQQGGTGLGLAISKALVEAMGGRIGFVQKSTGGAEFYVELPLSYQARSPTASGRFKKVE